MITVRRVSKHWARRHVAVDDVLIERAADICAVFADDEPVLVAGAVRESLLGYGRAWLVLLDGFKRHKLGVLRVMPRVTEIALAQFNKLEAYTEPGCDARFAEYCGLKFAGMRDKWARFEA